jgi:hypothetical protein
VLTSALPRRFTFTLDVGTNNRQLATNRSSAVMLDVTIQLLHVPLG